MNDSGQIIEILERTHRDNKEFHEEAIEVLERTLSDNKDFRKEAWEIMKELERQNALLTRQVAQMCQMMQMMAVKMGLNPNEFGVPSNPETDDSISAQFR